MDPLLIDTKQAAMLLHISRAHFYNMLNAGKIGPRPTRLGRKVLFVRAEMEAWTESGCVDRAQWDTLQSKAG